MTFERKNDDVILPLSGDKEGHAVSPFHDISLFANDEVSQILFIIE